MASFIVSQLRPASTTLLRRSAQRFTRNTRSQHPSWLIHHQQLAGLNTQSAGAKNTVFAAAAAAAAKGYSCKQEGQADTFDFRVFQYYSNDTVVSAWHDVPLYTGASCVNFLCEIPKETSAKMELATDEIRTPIKQDTKKGNLRHYPYNINWNYGMLPQTWEDPGHVDGELKAGVCCFYLLSLFLSLCIHKYMGSSMKETPITHIIVCVADD